MYRPGYSSWRRSPRTLHVAKPPPAAGRRGKRETPGRITHHHPNGPAHLLHSRMLRPNATEFIRTIPRRVWPRANQCGSPTAASSFFSNTLRRSTQAHVGGTCAGLGWVSMSEMKRGKLSSFPAPGLVWFGLVRFGSCSSAHPLFHVPYPSVQLRILPVSSLSLFSTYPVTTSSLRACLAPPPPERVTVHK